MAIEPISIRDLEERTTDVFEAVVVMTKRSKQVIHERLVEKAMNTETDEEMSVFDPVPEEINPDDYVELDKPTTVAISDFLDDKIKWHFVSEEVVL